MPNDDNLDPKLEAEYAEGDRLLKRIDEDEEFAKQFAGLESFEALTAAVRGAGFDISDEVIADIIEEKLKEEGDLSDDDLEAVSGGIKTFPINFLMPTSVRRRAWSG